MTVTTFSFTTGATVSSWTVPNHTGLVTITAMRVELERMRGDLASTRRELEDTRRELEETRREVHGLRAQLPGQVSPQGRIV